jgi:mono/diheme cytochrome c family protein
MGSLLPVSLLLGWLALTSLTVGTHYGTLAAQTETQPQTKPQPQPAEHPLPDGPGKEIVSRACVKCHSLDVVTNKRASQDEWAKTVDDMLNRGAELSDDEADKVVDYLSKNFKPAESSQKPQPDSPPQK